MNHCQMPGRIRSTLNALSQHLASHFYTSTSPLSHSHFKMKEPRPEGQVTCPQPPARKLQHLSLTTWALRQGTLRYPGGCNLEESRVMPLSGTTQPGPLRAGRGRFYKDST